MIGDAYEAKYRHAWPYRLAMWAAQWLCAVLIGTALGCLVYLFSVLIPAIVIYAVCYPIYRGWRLVTRSGAASKPNANARNLWRVCSVAALVLAIIHPLYLNTSTPVRVDIALYETRAIASAIREYAAHCGGLPAHDPGTDCPVARAESGGPYVVPFPNLSYWRQTNANGQIGGPFLTSWSTPWPTPPRYWKGVNDSYAYYILPGDRFVICARGEGTGANAEGGRSCP